MSSVSRFCAADVADIVEPIKVILAGAAHANRRNHRDLQTCRVGPDGRLPDGRGCDGQCLEDAFEALDYLKQRTSPDELGLLHRRAKAAVLDVQRRRDARRGLYARPARLEGPDAPAWLLEALPAEDDRRWLVRLLWWSRSADLADDLTIFPLRAWADRDGTSVEDQRARLARIVNDLERARPDFVEANVFRLLAGKDLEGSRQVEDDLAAQPRHGIGSGVWI